MPELSLDPATWTIRGARPNSKSCRTPERNGKRRRTHESVDLARGEAGVVQGQLPDECGLRDDGPLPAFDEEEPKREVLIGKRRKQAVLDVWIAAVAPGHTNSSASSSSSGGSSTTSQMMALGSPITMPDKAHEPLAAAQ